MTSWMSLYGQIMYLQLWDSGSDIAVKYYHDICELDVQNTNVYVFDVYYYYIKSNKSLFQYIAIFILYMIFILYL